MLNNSSTPNKLQRENFSSKPTPSVMTTTNKRIRKDLFELGQAYRTTDLQIGPQDMSGVEIDNPQTGRFVLDPMAPEIKVNTPGGGDVVVDLIKTNSEVSFTPLPTIRQLFSQKSGDISPINPEQHRLVDDRLQFQLDSRTSQTNQPSGRYPTQSFKQTCAEGLLTFGSTDELFRRQLQDAFQAISEQIDRVGTHLAQQIEILQHAIFAPQNEDETPTWQYSRKRARSDDLGQLSPIAKADSHENGHFRTWCDTTLDSTFNAMLELKSSPTPCVTCLRVLIYAPGKKQCFKCRNKERFFIDKQLGYQKIRNLFRCPFCMLHRFRSNSLLIEHIEKEHSDFLNKNDGSKAAKQRRIARASTNRPVTCEICPASFRSAAACDQHFAAAHEN